MAYITEGGSGGGRATTTTAPIYKAASAAMRQAGIRKDMVGAAARKSKSVQKYAAAKKKR